MIAEVIGDEAVEKTLDRAMTYKVGWILRMVVRWRVYKKVYGTEVLVVDTALKEEMRDEN